MLTADHVAMRYNKSAATALTARHNGQALEALNIMIIPPSKHNQICGVYEIVNLVNGHRYIGSSTDILGRFQDHRSGLRRGDHRNIPLQRAWNKYGESQFVFKILFLCEQNMVLFYEQICLDRLVTRLDYNIAKNTTAASRGLKRSEECRKKLSISHMGQKGSGRKKGSYLSLETRAKMSVARIGKSHPNKPHAHTLESKEKIRLALLGNHNTKGQKRTEETRKRISEAKKRYWEEKRANK